MKEIPILFSGEMVRAILDGRKTQTRRVIKLSNRSRHDEPPIYDSAIGWRFKGGPNLQCPYGHPGDRLWVRETWGVLHQGSFGRIKDAYVYRATDDGAVERRYRDFKWRPSIHMPRGISRITLEITGVRVQRVQEISVEDCIAEGLVTYAREHDAKCDLQDQFIALWDSINSARGFGWEENPWVWVIEFKRIT